MREQLTFHPVGSLDEVFAIALLPAEGPAAGSVRKTEMEEAAAAR